MLNKILKLKDAALHLNNFRKFAGNEILNEAVKSDFKLKILDTAPKGNVLVLAPHPDDDVFGCGGTIASHLKNGDNVSILYLTNGKNLTRKFEAEKATEILGVKEIIFWDNDDGEIIANDQTAHQLDNLFLHITPDIIYAPSFSDPHPDHLETAKLLTKTLQIFHPETTNQKTRFTFKGQILIYEVWQPIYANRLIKIDNAIEIKKEAILAHASQLKDRPYLDAIIGLNQYRGGMHNAGKYAEAFYACNKELFLKLFELIEFKK